MMKKFLVLLAVSALILTACKKTEIVPGLIGRWEVRRTYGGFAYHDSIYKAGNGNIYQFNRDSTYKRYDNGSLSAQGKFHIHQDNGYQQEAFNVILFDTDTYGEPISIKGTALTLGTSVADGITSEYQKINN